MSRQWRFWTTFVRVTPRPPINNVQPFALTMRGSRLVYGQLLYDSNSWVAPGPYLAWVEAERGRPNFTDLQAALTVVSITGGFGRCAQHARLA